MMSPAAALRTYHHLSSSLPLQPRTRTSTDINLVLQREQHYYETTFTLAWTIHCVDIIQWTLLYNIQLPSSTCTENYDYDGRMVSYIMNNNPLYNITNSTNQRFLLIVPSCSPVGTRFSGEKTLKFVRIKPSSPFRKEIGVAKDLQFVVTAAIIKSAIWWWWRMA